MDKNIDAYKEEIRRTFDLVKPIAADAAGIFYSSLWEIDPSTKPLFKNTDMKKQGLMLMKTLGLAVAMLTNMQKLVPVLQSLGRRHVSYGVTADMYPSVAEALLLTLGKGLGDECTEHTKEAWDWALGVISAVCIDAAREVDPDYGQANASKAGEPNVEEEAEEQEAGEEGVGEEQQEEEGGEQEEEGREEEEGGRREEMERARGEEPKVEESTVTTKERATTDESNTDGSTTDESTTEERTTDRRTTNGNKATTAAKEGITMTGTTTDEPTEEGTTCSTKENRSQKDEPTIDEKEKIDKKEEHSPTAPDRKAKDEGGRPQSGLKLKLNLVLKPKDVSEEREVTHQAIQCPTVRLSMTEAQLAEME